MKSMLEILQMAIHSNQSVSMVYNGGSRPGQARVVTPVSLSGDQVVIMEEGSYIKKTYKLVKVASVRLSTGESAINTDAVPPVLSNIPILQTLHEYAEHFRKELVDSGWHLSEEENKLGLAGYLKNGKPRKMQSITITYYNPALRMVFDADSYELRKVKQELTGRERPWRVDDYRINIERTFGSIDRAFSFFMERVRTDKSEFNAVGVAP